MSLEKNKPKPKTVEGPDLRELLKIYEKVFLKPENIKHYNILYIAAMNGNPQATGIIRTFYERLYTIHTGFIDTYALNIKAFESKKNEKINKSGR